MRAFFSLFQTLIFDKQTLRFAFGVVAGMAFSISVVLSTVGLMDGYSDTLKKALKHSEGHLTLHSRNGFFKIDEVRLMFLF